MADSELYATLEDHFDDLRRLLIRIAWTVGLGFGLLLYFYEPFFHLLSLPLKKVDTQQSISKQVLQHEKVINTTAQFVSYKVPKQALLVKVGENVVQLSPDLYHVPPQAFLEYQIPVPQNQLQILHPLEGMMMILKMSFWGSLACTSPIWGFWLLQFILPALKPLEKGYLIPFIGGSAFFITSGLALAYWVAIPLANSYLWHLNASFGINQWSLGDYVQYSLILFCGHAVAFEMGLVLLFLVHLRILTPEWLIQKRRWMIVLAFVLGAILTPPDVLTQFLLAIPLIGIYELAILYAKWRGNCKNPERQISAITSG